MTTPNPAQRSEDLLEKILALPEEDRLEAIRRLESIARAGESAPPQAPFPSSTEPPFTGLTASQQGLWFLDRVDPGNATYNITLATMMDGRIDVDALEQAFGALAERHEVLRSRFPLVEGRPAVIIEPPRGVPFQYTDHLDDSAVAAEIARMASGPFDLEYGPVWRIHLASLGPDRHLLVVVIHHIVFDGWSAPILVQEVSAAYNAFTSGSPLDLPPLPLRYHDYAMAKANASEDPRHTRAIEYWRHKLALPIQQNPLLPDRPRPRIQTANGATFCSEVAIDPARLTSTAADNATSSVVVARALFSAFVHRYTRAEDVVLGGPVADRSLAGTESLIGFFVDTIPYRMSLSSDLSLNEVIERAAQVAADAYRNGSLGFDQIVAAVQPERDPSRTPLFQIMFHYVPSDFHQSWTLNGVTATRIPLPSSASKFDVDVEMRARGGAFDVEVTYNTDLYEESTITRLVRSFGIVMDAALADPSLAIADLPLMTRSDEDWLLSDAAGRITAEPALPVVEQIIARALANPDVVAIEHADERLTYAETMSRARDLAKGLAAKGVSRGDLVVLVARRAPGAVVAMLGIHLAGAAYVPLETDTPPLRLASIIDDVDPKIILTDEPETLVDYGDSVLDLRRLQGGEIELPTVDLDDRAYIIYTSGSTGRPKGVVVTHRALATYVETAAPALRLDGGERLLQFHSLAFDASAEEVFCTLTTGATLVMRTDDMIGSVSMFLDRVAEERITVLDLPTEFWHVVAGEVANGAAGIPPSVHTVIIGGSAARFDLLRAWNRTVGSSPRLLNGYGPTETTIAVTMADLGDERAIRGASVSIGRPFGGATAYVVDERGRPVPVGVPGELCIGGPQLAVGYHRRTELTAERFIDDPWTGSRLYRTGDLVRREPDASLTFLGRVDRQIELRGFRIEPAEIEAQINAHPDVRAAHVLLTAPPEPASLVAYIVPAVGRSVDIVDVDRFLRNRLPIVMIPTLVVVDELPVMPSGKIDASRLPGRRRGDHGDVARLTDPTAARIAAIWADVLGVESVGPHDRFFDLGGHSLLAVEMISKVETVFGVRIPLETLFEAPSLDEFAYAVSTGHAPSLLVDLRPGGQRQPVICLPLVDGTLLGYEPIANHLDPAVPIKGVIPLASIDDVIPATSIEVMGSEFASTIMGGQKGPYRLLGWSFAGLLAVETARQIRSRGGTVELVVMLDSVAPRRSTAVERLRDASRAIRHGRSAGAAAEVERAWTRARIQLGRVRHGVRWKTLEARKRSLPSDLIRKRITHASIRAERRYRPEPYAGRVLYVRARHDDRPWEATVDRAWHALLPNMEVVDSSGTHLGSDSMLDEPHITHLCEELAGILRELDAPGATR